MPATPSSASSSAVSSAAASLLTFETRSLTLRAPDGHTLPLTVELADAQAKWEQGLMDRTELPEGHGMLFLFPDEAPRTFWMKNTRIPLDVLFFDAAGRFVSAKTMTPCAADPCTLYASDHAAVYALEVRAGFAARQGISNGWHMVFP